MFSSNQKLEVSGDLHSTKQLTAALNLALSMSEYIDDFRKNSNVECVYQKTDDGGFCIGWQLKDHPISNWKKYPFIFDVDILAMIIKQYLKDAEFQTSNESDGTHERGFLMKVIDDNTPGVQNPFYGIVVFYPYDCFYAK